MKLRVRRRLAIVELRGRVIVLGHGGHQVTRGQPVPSTFVVEQCVETTASRDEGAQGGAGDPAVKLRLQAGVNLALGQQQVGLEGIQHGQNRVDLHVRQALCRRDVGTLVYWCVVHVLGVPKSLRGPIE